MKKQNFISTTTAKILLVTFLVVIVSVQSLSGQGENAPEASGFEPVSATDMVNLSSGDMAYVLPLLEIDGFPVTLSYHAGIPMDMESSWVGLGWNINTGAIARGLVGTPDDWNRGKGLNFTYYLYQTETYTVNVGVGFGKAAEVGVGLSWGSNKSLSGSVNASIGPISASMDTDGNYSVGVSSNAIAKGLGFKGAFDTPIGGSGDKSFFGGSLSMSGNVSKSGISVGAGIGGGSAKGMNYGLGVCITCSGLGGGFSIGGGSNDGANGTSAGGGGSIGSFSAGDMSISSSGFYIPINIGIFSFGFGYQKQEISLGKGLNRYGYGSFYHNQMLLYTNPNHRDINNALGEKGFNDWSGDYPTDTQFFDYQRRNYYGDTYDQSLPQSELAFIGDYKNAIEKINFTFVGYDSYSVNASGINGGLKPLIGENSVLIGEGFEAADTDYKDKKMKVFYHNSIERTQRSGIVPTLSPRKSIANNNLFFAFDGQITNTINVTGNTNNSTSTTTNFSIGDFVNKGSTHLSRPKTGSFVEVFTNEQLDADNSKMLLPASLYRDKNTPLNRENLGYTKEGIGGYKITTADGKTYHFAQPVYQYEKIEHSYINFADIKSSDQSQLNSTSKRSATPYATHWLLTAITGPDFIDRNGNNFPDAAPGEEDYGYWLRLDHGQWSNAYAWRTPNASSTYRDISTSNTIKVPRKYRSYSTFNEESIDVSDAGHFLQGRKDLYYLDKIVSRNSIAYFVKDIRKDALGTDLDYVFNENSNDKVAIKSNSTLYNETIKGVENAKYDTEYLLRLDKIIIQKRDVNSGITTATGNGIGGVYPKTNATGRYESGGLFDSELKYDAKKHKLHQSNNVLDVTDFLNYDYSKASKVIQFIHNYELAKGSPNTSHANKDLEGRLSLQGIKFYGRDLWDYMPPYQFSYKRPDFEFARNDTPDAYGSPKLLNNKDSWGFIEGDDNYDKTLADSWSLNQIKTPQGSTIDINYEEDDFYVEAFSRRYWSNNLKFKLGKLSNGDKIVEIYNYNNLEVINFEHYFDENDEVYFDFWYFIGDQTFTWGSWDQDQLSIDIKANKFKIYSLSSNKLTLLIKNNNFLIDDQDFGINGFLNDSFTHLTNGTTFYGPNRTTYDFKSTPRGVYPRIRGNDRFFNLQYKLLATKSPMGNSGGGLKVKNIIVNGEAGAKYETEYTYKNPITEHSSGITSFYPVYGTTYVPYQNELPGPGVMYEWVTMKAKAFDVSGRELPSESTRYHYYTLQPNFHIFDPNFTMTDNDGETLFRASVEEKQISKGNITAKEIKIEKNLAKIGQLISVEQFNTYGHLLNKTTNTYKSKQASVQETFSSLKSVFSYDYNDDGEYSNRRLKKRLLSVSSRLKRGQILEKVSSVTPYGISSISYDHPDPYLGSYRTSIRTMADGTEIKNTKFPAYEKYPKMGSKILNINNKNMLTQEAMNISAVKIGSTWKTTNASINTWYNDWQYRDEQGIEPPSSSEVSVWRKHKTFVWKDNLDTNGAYATTVTGTNTYFNWGAGVPTNDKWQNVSEITRYNHYSSPLETKDINGNYASSKMADNWSKTVAGGNARYTEMYYSGAEHKLPNGALAGEITGSGEQSTELVHTGKYSLKVTNSYDQFFKVGIQSGRNHLDVSKKFRPGKYKVSVWANSKGSQTLTLKYDNQTIPLESSVRSSGESGYWTLLNYIVDIQPNVNTTLYFTGSNNSGNHFDDFRMHPIYASMNSYVYDDKTDELTYILDANNLATKFVYDKAGRLKETYKEVASEGRNSGGFKLVKEYNYNYKD